MVTQQGLQSIHAVKLYVSIAIGGSSTAVHVQIVVACACGMYHFFLSSRSSLVRIPRSTVNSL